MDIALFDVGGTHARLAALGLDGLPVVLGRKETRSVPSLPALLGAWKVASGHAPRALVAAFAGPVVDGVCTLTNAAARFDARAVEVPAAFLNDLEAAARGLPLVPDAGRIFVGDPRPARGAVAVLGFGTGLGQALVTPGGEVVAGEGGHGDFAPADAREADLLDFLTRRYGHVSWERVASGSACGDLLSWASSRATLGVEVQAALDQGVDPARVVLDHIDRDEACALTAEVLLQALAAEAGNAALRAWTQGGVVLCGGMSARLAHRIATPEFRRRFEAKGRFAPAMAQMPLCVVTDEDLGLRGCAAVARSM